MCQNFKKISGLYYMCVFSHVRLFRLLLVISETNVTIAAAPTFTMPVFLRVIYNVCQSIICFVFPAHIMLWTVNNVFPFLRNNACFFLAISLVVCMTHVALLDYVSTFLNVVVLIFLYFFSLMCSNLYD